MGQFRGAAAAVLVSAVIGSVLTGSPSSASATSYAPLNRPGPALSVPAATLAKALSCHGDFHANTLEPVLLDPATGVTPDENYAWNWEPAFNLQHRPWCALTMPFHTLGDIQTSGEYIVYGIRQMYALASRKIAVMGHSQGGMSMRWALRFWPDTRAKVDDVIGMAGDNHGTSTATVGFCQVGLTTCTPQGWQQESTSNFVAAMNSGAETFAGVSYTEIYSLRDEVVLPTTGPNASSPVRTGAGAITNVTTQSICPLDINEHLLTGTIDPVTYALATDALNHAGPANPARISKSACSQLFMPGVNPLNAQANINILAGLFYVALVPVPFVNLAGAPQVPAEPALKCYVFAAGCA